MPSTTRRPLIVCTPIALDVLNSNLARVCFFNFHISLFILCHDKPCVGKAPHRCALCRAAIVLPAGGVSSLDTSFFVSGLIEAASNEVEDPNEVRCEICEDEEATVRCSECSQFLGSVCATAHGKMKVSAGHTLISLDDHFSNTMTRTTHCSKHLHLEVDSHCSTCNVSLCSKCAVETHSSHSFRSLTEVATEVQEDITSMLLRASLKSAKAKGVVSQSLADLNGLQKGVSKSETNIREIFSFLRGMLDKGEAEMLGLLYDRAEGADKAARIRQEDAAFVYTELKGFCDYGCSLLAEGTPVEVASGHKMVWPFSLHSFISYLN